VRYSDGTVVAGATVTVRWAGPDGILGTDDDIRISATTDENGHFTVAGLPSGRYAISGTDGTLAFGPVELTLAELSELDGAVFEIVLGSEPGPDPGADPDAEPKPAGLAATGLDLGSLALGALVLLLLGAIIVGRAGRRELS
jgi:hypothetical protein